MKIINETNYTFEIVYENKLEDTLEPGEIQNIKDSIVIVIKEVIL